MKLCKDCKYMTGVAICVHPNNGISLINGEPKSEFCTSNRKLRACGPDGNWFEPKEIVVVEEPKPKKWWRIFK